MARKKRIWDPESFCHIVTRGNRRDVLFYEENDFKVFLRILQEIHNKISFELTSYCLMTNHIHLLMRSREISISKVMSLINKRYADYYNTKYNFTGHVFENRFFDKIIGTPAGVLDISRYIHMNPVKADIVTSPEKYKWSSYRYYMNTVNSPLLFMDAILDYFPGNISEKREKYQKFVMAEERGEVDYLAKVKE